MRLALLGVVGLCAVAPAARADVFVPADPPRSAKGDCVASGGNVYAVGAPYGDVRVSVAGGPATEAGLVGCPIVAAAADGTAAVLATRSGGEPGSDATRMIVRGANGTFGTPIVVGNESALGASLAVAPGGWAVATWVNDGTDATALVARPDGTTVRTVVDQVPKPSRSRPADETRLSMGRAGIDAGGNVTMVWERSDRRTSRLRVARSAGGGPPSAGADLTSAREARVANVGVAVAPAGGSLLAWPAEDGIRVMLDDGPPELLDTASSDAVELAASLGDDGTGLVAYLRANDELVALERAGGAWRRPRVLWSAPRRNGGYGSQGRELYETVHTTLAPSGRGAVVWNTGEEYEPKVYGALGQVGGAWGPGALVSSATRAAFAGGLALDARGVPRVLWSEPGLGVRGRPSRRRAWTPRHRP
jgi:hypothetical protein